METTAVGVSDLPKRVSPAQAAKSPWPSANPSPSDQGRGVTPNPAPPLSDLEVRLSILQTAYQQALAAGLKAQSQSQNGKLLIVLHGVAKCPTCQEWRAEGKCPTCATGTSTSEVAA